MAEPRFLGPGGIIGPLTEWAWGKLKGPAQERYGGVPGQPWNLSPQLRGLQDVFSVGPNFSRAFGRAESPASFGADFIGNFDPDLTYAGLSRASLNDLGVQNPWNDDVLPGQEEAYRARRDERMTNTNSMAPIAGNMARDWLNSIRDAGGTEEDVNAARSRAIGQVVGSGFDFAQPGAEIVGPLMGALASFGTFMKMSPRNWAGVVDNLARNPNAARTTAEGFRALNTLDPAGDILHTVGRQVDNARVTRTSRGHYELVIRGDGEDMLTVTRDFGDLRNFDPTAPVPQNALYIDYRGDSMLTDLGALAELADSQGTTLYVSTGGGFRPMQGRGTIPENVAPRFDQLGFELGGTVNDMDALYVRRPYPLDDAARRQEMAARGVEQGRLSEASDDLLGNIPPAAQRHIGDGPSQARQLAAETGIDDPARLDILELALRAKHDEVITRDPSLRTLSDALERIATAPVTGDPSFDALTHIRELMGTVEGNAFLVRHGFAPDIAAHGFGRLPNRPVQRQISDFVDWIDDQVAFGGAEAGNLNELAPRVRALAEEGAPPERFVEAAREVLGEAEASRLLNEMGYASPWGDVSGMSPEWFRQPGGATSPGEAVLDLAYGPKRVPVGMEPGPGGTWLSPDGNVVFPGDHYTLASTMLPGQYKPAVTRAYRTATRYLTEGDEQAFLRMVDSVMGELGTTPSNQRDLGFMLTELLDVALDMDVNPEVVERARVLLVHRYNLADTPVNPMQFTDVIAGQTGSGRKWSLDFFNASEPADFARLGDELNLSEDTVRGIVEGVRRELRAGREGTMTGLLDRAIPEMENIRRLVGEPNFDTLVRTLRRVGRENAHAMLSERSAGNTLGGIALPPSAIDDILDVIYLSR